MMDSFSFAECINQKVLMQIAAWILQCLNLDVDVKDISSNACKPRL